MGALINQRLVPVKSDVSRSRLYADYSGWGGLFYLPTTVFTDASGREIGRVTGNVGPAEFGSKIETVLAGYAG